MADEGTMRRIWRYKSDLEQEPDEEKLLEILGKLRRLPVTISALQETGIGKLVNSLKKRGGVVGELACKVVSSWKAVVEKEVKTSRNRSPSPDPANRGNSSSNEEKCEKSGSEDGSDADSWNSFQEEDDTSASRSSKNKTSSQSTRKRKHYADSDNNEEETIRASEVKKETQHPTFNLDKVKVEPADGYRPAQKKKHGPKSEDYIKSENDSNTDRIMKVTSHTITVKMEGDRHSSGPHYHGVQHSSSSGLQTSEEKVGTSSNYHRVSEKGDGYKASSKVDRRQKRHSISSNEEDEDQASDNSQSNNMNADPPLSSSNKHTSSSHSHKYSSSSSHGHTSSSRSHKHSSSSSHGHSSSSRSDKHSSSSSSHGHSSSSHSHKHSSLSSSHIQSSSQSSNHRKSSSSRHEAPSPSSDQQRSVPEALSIKSSSSSSRQASISEDKPGSSISQENHKRSDRVSPSHEKSSKKIVSSTSQKGSTHHSGHSHGKHSAASDKSNSSSTTKMEDENVLSSQKGKSSSSKEKSLSSSHRKADSSDNCSTSNKHSGKEKHDRKSSSSAHKHVSPNPDPSSDLPGFRVSSSTVHIKSEGCPGTEVRQKSSLSTSSTRTPVETKSTSNKHTKTPGSASHKKSKPKNSYEEPDLDLFSDALHIKTEPSSPVHRLKSVKQPASKPSNTPLPPSPTPGLSPQHVSADIKVKLEPVFINDHKSSPKNNSNLKDIVKQENNENSDSSQKQKKIKSEKNSDVSSKKAESPLQHEDNMSFEDFMAFDEIALAKKGKSSTKPAAKGSTSSSKSSHSKADKPAGSKWTSSLGDLSLSSKTSFSMPAPASNVTVSELDILSLLPETQANYKPLRFGAYYRDEEEEPIPEPLVDPDIIGIKNISRTHVYSGKKHGITEVKPLYDLCMQVLIDNIDAIDCVGGIPYSILKPVLERCSAQQLYQLEDYNPHFLEDSEELWKVLCERDFRGCKPKELETWRELYMRRFEERELKYQRLKQSMSSSISKGQAGRKAQLAYVDTMAKPPREVLRKQKQFGTGCIVRSKNNPNMKGSSSGLKAYKPSMLVPAHNPMDDRPRMARALPPMMAKSLQMRKNMRH